MTCCKTLQLLEPVASSPQTFTSRRGSADSMEAIDSSGLTEGKDIADLVEGGIWSLWQFQRQPADTTQKDVGLLDDAGARWRKVAGDLPA